jgi:acyl carrier protein
MRNRIKQVMAAAFEVSAGTIPDDAGTENFEAWDSLGHMQLMLGLEAEFGIEIPSETMLELLSLVDIESYLGRAKATAAR